MTRTPPAFARLAARMRASRTALLGLTGAMMVGIGAVAFAQIAGGDRGIAPINASADFAVGDVRIDVTGKTAFEARANGWREAQRLGWAKLYAKTHAGSKGPKLSDSVLDGIVSAIVVEHEQIGPNRYIARLGVLFDRARAGQVLGVSGRVRRSPPLLVIPVTWVGNMPQAFEMRSPWQRAWARYRTGDSAIDYVRTAGTGVDTLLLTASQTERRNRHWWRAILDQYGAADVLVPSARLEFAWPGGPVTGHFAARYGPDRELLGSFRIKARSAAAIPAMMARAVARIDGIYTDALAAGLLRPDPSLIIEEPVDEDEIPEIEETEDAVSDDPVVDNDDALPPAAVSSVAVQFDTPDAATVSAIEAAVGGASGVISAQTSSLALGGTSVMRVTYRGDLASLRASLQARGFTVQEGGGTLRISR